MSGMAGLMPSASTAVGLERLLLSYLDDTTRNITQLSAMVFSGFDAESEAAYLKDIQHATDLTLSMPWLHPLQNVRFLSREMWRYQWALHQRRLRRQNAQHWIIYHRGS